LDPSEIDVHRIEYFRAVTDFAEMVTRGADLSAVCERARYVQLPFLRSWFRRFHRRSGCSLALKWRS